MVWALSGVSPEHCWVWPQTKISLFFFKYKFSYKDSVSIESPHSTSQFVWAYFTSKVWHFYPGDPLSPFSFFETGPENHISGTWLLSESLKEAWEPLAQLGSFSNNTTELKNVLHWSNDSREEGPTKSKAIPSSTFVFFWILTSESWAKWMEE